MTGLVIIGGSYAGVQIATSARELGYADGITIISDESMLPYQRPPLSKAFLVGASDETALLLRSEKYFAERNVRFMPGRRAQRIDRIGRRVVLDDGCELPFDRVAITTGSRPRRLSTVTADANVAYLRSLQDAHILKRRLAECSELVILGGGFIGLEVAASARKLGKKVVVIESARRLMERAISPALSRQMLALHRANGVDVHLGMTVQRVFRSGARTEVHCGDGTRIQGDLILIGIGGIANLEIAESAGLHCDNGVVVDEIGRTASAEILAAGDCTSFYSPHNARRIRLESVQHAQDQGKSVGACVAGKYHPYTSVPRFWSDQYDAKFQMVGLSEGYANHVIRGSLEEGAFSVFLYRNDRLVAVDSVNRPGDQLIARKLIASAVSPSPAQAEDLSFDLKTLAPDRTPMMQ